jgi:hypothetical protein
MSMMFDLTSLVSGGGVSLEDGDAVVPPELLESAVAVAPLEPTDRRAARIKASKSIECFSFRV